MMKKISSLFACGLLLLAMQACSPKISGSSPLFGSRWVLLDMNNVPVQVSGTDKDAQLRLDYATKTISGSGGCNRLSGGFNAGTETLEFAQVASTKMYCADQRFEDKFLENLRKVKKYTASATELNLMDGSGQVLLHFKKMD